MVECLYLICHLSPPILTRSCSQLLPGRVLGQGAKLTPCFGMVERVRGGAGGDLFILCMHRGILCSLGVIRALLEIVTGSLQPGGI